MDFEEQQEDVSVHNVDSRTMLAQWANGNDEWVCYIVGRVLSERCPLTAADTDYAYALFRQEKALDERSMPIVPQLQVEQSEEDAEEPLVLMKVSEVAGVNALVAGAVIEPHEGLTILFGENGTGKTGYARILKALADSRTADEILGDIDSDIELPKSAKIAYKLGDDSRELVWSGERGKPPFTRMSVFDELCVNFYVDDDLDYVYVPGVLALFNHVSTAVKSVQDRVASDVENLVTESSSLLARFPRESEVYPMIQTLGASTDLDALKSRASTDPKIDERIEAHRRAVAALEADTLTPHLGLVQRSERVLREAIQVLDTMQTLDVESHNANLDKKSALLSDRKAFRDSLFAAASLPASPEDTWEKFVASGEAYRTHLDDLGVHDPTKCLYCRQTLYAAAADLVAKYSEYLADKISQDIATVSRDIDEATRPLLAQRHSESSVMLAEYAEREDKPAFYNQLKEVVETLAHLQTSVDKGKRVEGDALTGVTDLRQDLEARRDAAADEIGKLQENIANRITALADAKKTLNELVAAAELSKAWPEIATQVGRAQEADKLRILSRGFPGVSRRITDLSKAASDQLINQNFEKLFAEECTALRAPQLKVEFIGRHGRAHRRKVISSRCKPSKVLSEGEQKVLAIADFLAETRLSGITAPVIFDDPVSSLDHRRINEVAQRVASLAEDHQVIVFTHDILFATTLLSLFEKSRRCAYYQVTDDDGKGKVTKATGPRWDTLSNIKKNINETIQSAKTVDGEARAALVRTGYDQIRAWCEVFTEQELLRGVTERYQPNVRMTVLPSLKVDALPAAIETVTRIFEEACRFIEGHSQPLPSLGVSPTLPGLEAHWQELQECRKAFADA